MNNFRYNISKALSMAASCFLRNGIQCYWWNNRVNFGDLLTPELLHFFGKIAIHSYPKMHDNMGIVAVGSLIQMLPQNYRGTILGTGLIQEQLYRLPDANICSVRGELTKKAMQLNANIPTGDLGLLSDNLITKPAKKIYKVGIVPHYVDKSNPVIKELTKKYKTELLIIDVERTASKVINDIAKCEMIASSSLHGIIAADALGIPNVWLKISTEVVGDGFKFFDYNSSIDADQGPISINDIKVLSNIEKKLIHKNVEKIKNKKDQVRKLLQQTLMKL